MRGPAVVGAALAALGLGTGAAAGAPLTLVQQRGIVHQVVRGDRSIAWVRCPSPAGPSQVWTRSYATKASAQVGSLTSAGCDTIRLAGLRANTLVASVLGADGLRRLSWFRLPAATETQLDKETSDAAARTIVAADAYGPLVAWVREQTIGGTRVAEVVTADTRRPTQTSVVLRQPLLGDVVRITGVWRDGSGNVAWREVLRTGGSYSYGTGRERLVLRRTDGTTRVLSDVTGPVHIAGADLERDRAVWSLVRDDSTAAWIYSRELPSGAKRLVRVARTAAQPGVRPGFDVPLPRLSGSRLVWRERTRLASRAFTDGVQAVTLPAGRIRSVVRTADRRDQRLYVGPPDLLGAIALWPQVTFAGPGGWRGGYAGLASAGATTRILTAGAS
jgi:hypothetical protein